MSASASKPASGSGSASTSSDALVLSESTNKLRTLTLNRPKALNALNTEMVVAMKPLLKEWEEDKNVNLILLKGEGRAFCAGGDVVTLVKRAQDEQTRREAIEFFQHEYEMDNYIAKMKTPVIALLDGITMGGGVGISVHAPFRIATEKTVVSMPETTIGLFPDVGALFFLSRMDGELGAYLGLTSERLSGWAAFQSGFASHFIPSASLPALVDRLSRLEIDPTLLPPHETINSALSEFTVEASDASASPTSTPSAYPIGGLKRAAIDQCFKHDTVSAIVADLKALEQGKVEKSRFGEGMNEDAEVREWAKKTRETIENRSPTSCAVTLAGLRQARGLDIDEVFELDMKLATTCCHPELHADFVTGVTHLLIDKKKDRAPWSPSSLSSISSDSLRSTFFDSPPSDTPKLSLSPRTPYTTYPHAKFSLPSEHVIGQMVKGEWHGSGSFAITKDELGNMLDKDWKGKKGMRSKMEEVVARRCKEGEGGTLKWRY